MGDVSLLFLQLWSKVNMYFAWFGQIRGVTKHRTVCTGPTYSDILHWI